MPSNQAFDPSLRAGALLPFPQGSLRLRRGSTIDAPRSQPPARPTVLVYRHGLLPISETFIKEQVGAYRCWRGVLIGRRSTGGLDLGDLDVRLLRASRWPIVDRLWWRAMRLTEWAPTPIANRLRDEAPSLLHAHFGLDGVEAWPLARALDLPMVVTLHGYDINITREFWEGGGWGRRFRDYPRRLLALAAAPRVRFVAVSQAIRRGAIAFGVPAEKIDVRHIGVDIRRFAPTGRPIAQRGRNVLFVGRLVEKKGCAHLVRAMAAVKFRAPAARLTIIGDGDERASLQQLAANLGVQAAFLGAQPAATVARELEQARVLCLPSVAAANGDAEGFGQVLLEAQACGVPVVTSARGGAEEGICDGVTGFAFAEGDEFALADRLTRILIDDDLATTMSCEAAHFVSRHFDLDRCTAALEMLYYDIINTDWTRSRRAAH
jgi:glycosyltransferase involved in cell wall biosynthesis